MAAGRDCAPWSDDRENLDPLTGWHARAAPSSAPDADAPAGVLATPKGDAAKTAFRTPQSMLAHREPLRDITPLFRRDEVGALLRGARVRFSFI